MSKSKSTPSSHATLLGYGDVAEEYRRLIVHGEWKPGQRIPTVRKTTDEFRVSVVTAQRAMRELQQQGFIESRGPRGSFVSDAWKTMTSPTRVNRDALARPLCVGLIASKPAFLAHWELPTVVALERMLTTLTCQAGGTFRRYQNEFAEGDAGKFLEKLAEPPRPDVLVMHSGFAAASSADFVARLRDNGTHCIDFSASLITERLPYDAVCLDDVWAFRTLAEELVALGHRRLAYAGAVMPDGAAHPWSEMRRQAVVEALQAKGLDLVATYLLDQVGGALADAETWRGKDLPTAVICANDNVAVRIMKCFHAWGLRVPQDVSVTGYDNSYLAGVEWDITTFTMPEHRVAEAILSLARRRVQGDAGLGDQVRITVRPVLVPRGSWQRVAGESR